LPWQVYLLLNTPAFAGRNNRTYRFPVSGLYGAFLVKGGRSTTFLSFLAFLGPFLLFDRATGFLPPRPQDAKADARSGGQGREDGGTL
jgi:hypothetical protein